MTKAASPSIASASAYEAARLAALQRYKVLDTQPEAAFDRITSLAAQVFDGLKVFISFVDQSCVWFKSVYGFDPQELAWDLSTSRALLLYDGILVFPDLQQEQQFIEKPVTIAAHALRFYAGASLTTPDGYQVGSLCLLDTQPRDRLTDAQKATLSDLAALVMDELELRLNAYKVTQVETALRRITQGMAATTGQDFFNALVQNLSIVLGVNHACVSMLVDENPETLKTIALYTRGEIVDNVVYSSQGTPCLEVIQQRQLCCYPQAIQSLFPEDQFLVAQGLESYAAIPFFNTQGKLLGLLGVMDTQPMEQAQLIESLLPLFALQVAAELERQQAEEIRQEAAQHLQLYADVVRNTQVGLVVWHLEDLDDPGSFRLLIANPAASEATGFDFQSALNRTMAESFPRLLETSLIGQYLDVVKHGRSLDFNEVPYDRDGVSPGIYSLKAFPLPNHCLGLTFENITAHKQVEQQLQRSQRYNQQITEALPGVLFVHDIIQQQNVYTNRQIADLLGYTSEQVQAMGDHVLETLVHPQDLERVFDYFEAFRRAPEDAVLSLEYQVRHANGQWRWMHSQSVVFKHSAEGMPSQVLGVSIDITDHKQSEAALVEQEQRYRYIFEAVNIAIWEEDFSDAKAAIDQLKDEGVQDVRRYLIAHPEFAQAMIRKVRIRDVNPASLQMFGAHEKEELLASLDQIFVSETESVFIEELVAIAHDEPFFAAETVLQTLQGERLTVWVSIAFPSASESYDHVLVSLVDISDRKQAEANLQASEERYRHLAEVMPQIVWTTDANGMATYFNPHWYDYTGMSEIESRDLGALAAMHPDERDRVRQGWLAAVATGESYEIEIRLRRWDGVYRWFLCRGLPIRNINGQIVSWVGTDTDIDDQKRIQEALHHSEERLSLALHSAQAVIWQWFKEDNRSIWSDENFRLLGYEPGEVSASYNSWLQALHPDDRDWADQAVQQAFEKNSPIHLEYRVCLPDGSVRWLADMGRITYDNHGNPNGMIGIQVDISERKQSELERERSEAILNSFLAASPIALTLFDQDLRFIYINEALAQLNHLPLSEHLGRTLDDVLPDMAPAFGPLLRRVIETQEPVLNLEYSGEVRPGVYRHTIANHFPVCLPDGEVLGVGVTVTDISELKRVETELRQSEERLSLALKATNQGLYDLNVQTGEALVSPEYARILGYEPEEFHASHWNWRDRMHPDDVATAYQMYEEYIAGQHDEYRVEFRQRTKEGAWIWVLSIGKIVAWDAEGRPLRMLGTHTDISDRKQAEQNIQEHSERLNLLYETTRELLSAKQPLDLMNHIFDKLSTQMELHYYYHFQVVHRRGHPYLQLMNYQGITQEQAQALAFVEFGESMCGLVAQERHQLTLSQSEIAAHPNAQGICSMGVTAYSGQPLMVHGRLLGTLSFGSRTRTHFTDEESYLLRAISEQVAIALDRSELVTSLQQQTEDLAKANHVKDEFLAVLSHELRSPLNPILGWTKLLQSGRFDAEKTKQALDIIERNARQQTQLIDDLLDISRILRGKLILSQEAVDLAFTIESALETVRLAAEAKNIQLKTDLQSDLPPILGDAGRLHQMISNLLSNAIKFTYPGGQVEVRLKRVMGDRTVNETSRSEGYSEYAQIQVKDTGKGIAPEFLPYVFESFRQEDSKTTRKFGGLGLGLAIVRQLTELHGGTVHADSPGEGMGALFTIHLPLMHSQRAVLQEPFEQSSMPSIDTLAGIRILVVDDEQDMRDLALIILEQVGAKVQVAASAAEALSLFDRFQPMLVISDVGMPDMDGYDLIRQINIRSAPTRKPVLAIALTAYAMEQDRQKALAAGFQRHLAKPVEPTLLIQAIATLINQE